MAWIEQAQACMYVDTCSQAASVWSRGPPAPGWRQLLPLRLRGLRLQVWGPGSPRQDNVVHDRRAPGPALRPEPTALRNPPWLLAGGLEPASMPIPSFLREAPPSMGKGKRAGPSEDQPSPGDTQGALKSSSTHPRGKGRAGYLLALKN